MLKNEELLTATEIATRGFELANLGFELVTFRFKVSRRGFRRNLWI